VIACDMPIGLIVPDGEDFEAVANAENGSPAGREREFAELLSFIKHAPVKNTVWLTADVHYTAAHRYDPAQAGFKDFNPFYEFVSGPLHAGTFGPSELDATFGPQVLYQKAPALGESNLAPSAGLQFFGEVTISALGHDLSVILRDLTGAELYQIRLEAE
jgi:alkaline phosphatase D